MRPRELLSEMWRNINSGTSRSLLTACVLAFLLLGSILGDGMAQKNVFGQQREFRDVGGAILTAQAPGRVSASRCLALADAAGVNGVFAYRLRDDPDLALAVYPSGGPDFYDVVGEPARVLGGTDAESGGIFLPSEVATLVGKDVGDDLAFLRDGATLQIPVRGVFPYAEDGRMPIFANAVLLPSHDTASNYDGCWVSIWPYDAMIEPLLDTTVVGESADGTSAQVITGQMNSTLGPPQNTADLLEARPTRLLGSIVAVMACMVMFALVRMRRSELAMSRHLGQSGSQQCLQMCGEASYGVFAAIAVSLPIGLIVLLPGLAPDEARYLVKFMLLTAGGTALCAVLGSAIGVLTVRESLLQHYAKDK